MLKVAQVLLQWLVSKPLQVLRCSLNGSISPGQAYRWLLITTWLAGEVGNGFSGFVCHVELKTTPTDAIFGCSQFTQRINPPHYYSPTPLHPYRSGISVHLS